MRTMTSQDPITASWKWADGSCAHMGCDRAATDERHGFALCMGHFFQALQWDAQRQGVTA